MTVTTRMIPANGNTGGVVTGWAGPGDIGGVASRRYYNAGGSFAAFIDVPGDPSGDASLLTSQGFIYCGASGPTSARPTSQGWLKPGLIYVDTTLNAVIVWDSFVWKSVLTGAVV
jgi:hypothetical protein